METNRPCGCKGIRSCLVCESEHNIVPFTNVVQEQKEEAYVYCPFCNKAWKGWNGDQVLLHPHHTGESIAFPGVFILLDFLSEGEQRLLMNGIDAQEWEASQSGRRKQNYGPKCNFKKQKIKLGDFKGFPRFSEFVQDKLHEVDILKGFQVIEQCSLEYTPEKGASIDPHIDDCWIWGERIVTVNVCGDSVLTMTKFQGPASKYNLNQVSTYPCLLNNQGHLQVDNASTPYHTEDSSSPKHCVRIFMPAKSLLVLYGPARYDWEHSVLREDVTARRVCIAYREFTPPYLPNGTYGEVGQDILNNAKLFWS